MEDKRIRSAFQNMQPDDCSKNKIWEQIEQGVEKRNNKERRLPGMMAAKMVRTAATILVCLVVGAVSINAATGGKAWKTVKEILNIEHKEIVNDISEYPVTGAMSAYAPDICAVDEKQVMFATKRGMILMDRKTNELKGIIDLQKIGCFYFEAETMKTDILKKGNKVVIFNEENSKPVGNYYVYAIKDADVNQWEPIRQGTDEKTLKNYYRAWKKYEGRYSDTEGNPFVNREKLISGFNRGEDFSENVFSWKNNAGEKCISYLIINTDYRYVLHTVNTFDKTEQEQLLNLQSSTEKTTEKTAERNSKRYPKFQYVGEDKVLKAICPFIRKESRKEYYHEKNSIWIPAFAIYARVEKDGYLYVFGNFWSETYYKNGNILEDVGGGEAPARIKLKKTGNEYKVVEYIKTGEGAMYLEGIKAFTKDFPGVYETFIKKQNQQWIDSGSKIEWNPETRIKYMKMYVEENHLDIKYYQDIGWDPVEIK